MQECRSEDLLSIGDHNISLRWLQKLNLIEAQAQSNCNSQFYIVVELGKG